MYRFKREVLRRIIEEAGGPTCVMGLEADGEQRTFVYSHASNGKRYHLTHCGRYINFPKRGLAQDLIAALRHYVRVHFYEWHEVSTAYSDITTCQRQVTAKSLVLIDEHCRDGAQHIPTGLAYFKNEMMNGSYYPLHLASASQLLGVCWSDERAIQRFLQLLSSCAPSPDHWQNTDRLACIDQFPGGFPAIFDLGEKASIKR